MTATDWDFDRLQILFRRVSSLPPLPRAVLQLLNAIDEGQASAIELERIIAADPGLTAELLRVAGTSPRRFHTQASTLRQVILILGQRTVRAVAVSLALRSICRQRGKSNCFDPVRFARHSVTVGVLARYLHVRSFGDDDDPNKWSHEEVFAAGVIHDISWALLAQIAPEIYDRLWNLAKLLHISLDQAFVKSFGVTANMLGATVAETWGFPSLFAESLKFVHDPLLHPSQVPGLACLSVANEIAVNAGMDMTEWYTAPKPLGLLRDVIQVEDAELQIAVQAVNDQVDRLLSPLVEAA